MVDVVKMAGLAVVINVMKLMGLVVLVSDKNDSFGWLVN